MEMLIVTSDADIRLLEYSISDITEYIKPEKITVAANLLMVDEKTRAGLKDACSGGVSFVDNAEIFEGLNAETVRRELEKITGKTASDYCVEWYLRQFVKLGYAFGCSEKEYLFMESDLIPLKKLPVHDGQGRPVMFLEKGDRAGTGSGIMLIRPDIVKEITEYLDKREDLKGDSWWIRILNTLKPDSLLKMSFSVYDLYGSYVRRAHPDIYTDIDLRVFYRARRLLGKLPSKELKEWAGKSFGCIRLRRSDRPSEGLIRINSNRIFRTLIPAAAEDFVDRYFESLSDKWAKVCRFSVRETFGNEINRLRNLKRYFDGRRKLNNKGMINKMPVTDGCIVLTHSGTRPIPEYTVDCVEQIRLFSDIPVFFVCSREKEIPERLKKIAGIVYIEDMPVTERHLRFFRKLSSFRANFDNFFQHATERFFIIDEAMSYLNLKNVIHMENDIMLYEDAVKLLDRFREIYDDITVPRMTEQFCMATVMYIPDRERMGHFLDYVLAHILDRKSNDVNKKTNDMIMLADYLRENGKNALPLINKGYIDEYGLVNSKGETAPKEYLDDYFKYTENFGGFFDPQPIGQYLGGTDRKPKGVANNAGYSNEYSYIDVSKLDIRWKQLGERCVPILVWKDREYRIYNLHVHCKELNRFRSDIERR